MRAFRAPARVTFGRSPKSDQKVCLKPKVSRLPARYTLFPIVGLYRTVTKLFICRADKRIVSASAPLPLISATVGAGVSTFQSKRGSEKRSSGVISRPPLGGGWQREALTGGEKTAYYVSPSVALRATPPSQREARTRLRARRGDVGIAPYGRAQGVRSCNVSPSVTASPCHLPHRGRQGRACGRGGAMWASPPTDGHKECDRATSLPPSRLRRATSLTEGGKGE